jgi:large subunit ribosomal protein L3
MPTARRPRRGSLQYWPRSRAAKIIPSVNWKIYDKKPSDSVSPLGFIVYKAGMISVEAKDNTPHSMTKGKKIIVPATILECPPAKIFSVRFYNNNQVVFDSLLSSDKELKKLVKLPKQNNTFSFDIKKQYDDIRIIVYSLAKKTNIQKTPHLIELALSGSLEDKKKFVQEHLAKEISISEVFKKGSLVDVHGVTKGYGLSGPVKRFGIALKSHKSEKGVRRPGSLAPWHPSRVTFRAPMAGQYGMFSRVIYNNKILDMGKEHEALKNLKHFGNLGSEYLLLRGSVTGPVKRPVLLTAPARVTKKQDKLQFEVTALR